MSTQAKKPRIIRLLFIFLSLLIINGVILLRLQIINDAFYFRTVLPRLIEATNSGNSVINPMRYSYPLTTPFLFTLQLITDLDYLTISFLPIIPIIPVFFYIAISRELLGDGMVPLSAGFGVFVFIGARRSHFFAYSIGELLYVLFIYIVVKYILDKDNRISILVILSYITLKGFSPHAETWAFTLLILLLLIFSAVNRTSELVPSLFRITTVCGIIYLFINKKIYDAVIGHLSSGEVLLSDFLTILVSSVIGTNSTLPQYQVAGSSSPTLVKIKIIYYVAIIVIVLLSTLSMLYTLYKKNIQINIDSLLLTIVAYAVMFSFIPDMFVTTSFGELTLEVLSLVTPLIGLFLFQKYSLVWSERAKDILVVAIVLLILMMAIFSQFTFLLSDSHQNFGPKGQDQTATLWVNEEYQSEHVLSDFHTQGIIEIYSKMNGDKNIYHESYSSNNYEYIISGEKVQQVEFDVLVINNKNIDQPLMRGYPDWSFFRPLDEYKSNIDSNIRLTKSYSNGKYIIYGISSKNTTEVHRSYTS
ncbi:hypothetical protein [Halorubrum miltondacostae]|uniref:Glycosyltransferase RgtA/B/C/D-like domain-containing protein n=1 Tax=Halorubrum miltondacostae TaxID=3076378 RepID=A0ABD5M7V1_9EURY